MKRRSSKIVPEWLDRDPDEDMDAKNSVQDPYGDMRNTPKASDGAAAVRSTDPATKTPRRQPLAEFCGRWGMRLHGDLVSLDLHGLRQTEAVESVERAINAALDDGRIKKLRIITGKGNHSDGVGVLAQTIQPHVLSNYAKFIAQVSASPGEFVLGGVVGKGYFDIRFK
ncbi:MAG: Smr/MutS family protein [Proteobacteria bacterium]|nr:Smr/MutS family protein [Pseudomonadota bacterium]